MNNLNKKVISLAAATTVILGGAAAFVVPTMAAATTGVVTAATDGDDATDVVGAITAALSGLVSDGTITQAQADAVARTLAENPPMRPDGGRGPHGDHGDHGDHGPGRPDGPMRAGLEAAAETLGMTAEEIRVALEAGGSLASLAEDKGVARADLITAMVDAVVAEINAHEAEEGDDPLTPAQIERITAFTTTAVDRVGLPERGGPGLRGHEGDRPGTAPGRGAHHRPETPSASQGKAAKAKAAKAKAKAAKAKAKAAKAKDQADRAAG
jgi:hypothetical protein